MTWLKTNEYVIYRNGRKVEDYKISISPSKFQPNKYSIWIYQKNGERVYSTEAINSFKFTYTPETQTIKYIWEGQYENKSETNSKYKKITYLIKLKSPQVWRKIITQKKKSKSRVKSRTK
jgi:hypothetical protein